MARLRLPEPLRAWKVTEALQTSADKDAYRVSTKSGKNAKLTVIKLTDETYSRQNVSFLESEAAFIHKISAIDGVSNYLGVYPEDLPGKRQFRLFILTTEDKPLAETLDYSTFSENDVVDFGLKMSEVLDKLEQQNIYHGNINPNNIFVTADGSYRLGNFIDAESNIEDMSFVAPEIKKNENPDFTTDIYSVGLMMYAMCNAGKLPYEQPGVSKQEAVEKRLNATSFSAPQEGSEKLKSVIVIACQPNNKNRWKNAGNIRNALASIKSELPEKKATAAPAIVAPAVTNFESNVFDEFSFDSFDTEEPETPATPPVEETPAAEKPAEETPAEPQKEEITPAETAAEPALEEAPAKAEAPKTEDAFEEVLPEPVKEEPKADDADFDDTKYDAPEEPEEDLSPIYKEPEIDNRVFDDFETQRRVVNLNAASVKTDNDYGDFFEDEEQPEKKESKTAEADKTAAPVVTPYSDYRVFGDDGNDPDAFDNFDEEGAEEEKKSRKGFIAAIIIGIIILLALLAVFFYLAMQNGLFGGKDNNKDSTQPTATAALQETTVDPTATVAPTTVKPTQAATEPASEVYLEDITGYDYSYAKELLEESGFKVKEGAYRYSDEYEADLVLSMSPEGDAMVKPGSTVTLDISLGADESGNEDATDAPESSDTDDTDSDGNTSDSSSDDSSSQESKQDADSKTDSDDDSEEGGAYSSFAGNTSYYSQSEISSMSREEMTIALNEIYARRGRIFTDPELKAYFSSQSWYKPLYNEEQFSENVVFNDYEIENITLIVDEMTKKGYR